MTSEPGSDEVPEVPGAHPMIQRAFELGGDSERIIDYYEEWAATYDDDVGRERYAGPAMCVETLGRCAGLVPTIDVGDVDLHIVDGGCGTGLLGVALAAVGYRVIDGVDLSPAMVDAARTKGVYRDLEAGVDLLGPPSARWRRSADVMMLAGVFTLGHLPGRTLETIAEWVRPGGLLVLSTRKQYYDTSDYREVADELIARGTITELVRTMDGPGTEDSPGHYFAYQIA